MTVGELRARLAGFDDSLPVFVADDDANGADAPAQPVRHANLPEDELHVLLTTARSAAPDYP